MGKKENGNITARQFIDLIEPEHGRTSCSDEEINNGFWNNKIGRCTRCMYLEIIEEGVVPKGFDNYNCAGA